ncbi:MAG TPA: LysR family transcriptional regulator [Burkholderiales bacterium]|nr:LysR family transcriptional regulator [Burkholderiales bacterium]
MELRDLGYLRAVAVHGHLGRAAKSVKLTQPALTKCIARLERELAVKLLERTPKGVRLTTCGEHLVAHAERVYAADVDIRRELTELATGQAGHLRIGTGLAAGQRLLPAACIALLQRCPGVTLDICTGNSETLFPALQERKLDVVLASITTACALGFNQTFLMHDQVTVLSRREHPVQRRGGNTIEALADASWALPPLGTAPWEWLAQRFRELGLGAPKCVVRTGTLSTLLQIVAETDLLAFQSWSVVSGARHAELLRPVAVSEMIWNRPVGAFTRKQGYSSPVVDRLIEALQEAAAAICEGTGNRLLRAKALKMVST